MADQWRDLIYPMLSRHPIDYTHTVDLACGHGRNTEILKHLAKKVTLIDVNEENTTACRERFTGDKFSFLLNSGFDLSGLPDHDVTFIYCFDAMVHFDVEIVLLYAKEFKRVLKPGGYGFIHHSNYTGSPGRRFPQNPHWRNFMSKDLFAHLCINSGLDVEEQLILDWGEVKDLDCFTVFRASVEK